jgi:hypothetical protein
LKGRDTGIMNEPKLRAWIQDSVPPASDYDERPGRWVGEAAWPAARDASLALHLADGRLLEAKPTQSTPLTHRSPLVTGITWGEWCPYGFHGELPVDQRPDDGRSLCFDGAPLGEPLALFGAPVLTARLAIDRPAGLIIARLCDVAPDGSSRLMSYGVLNLTHRAGHDRTAPMIPGQFVDVRLQLNDLGEGVAAGHRLRLALSTSYWPMLWPSAEPVTLTLMPGASTLSLPLRSAPAEEGRLAEFQPPEMAPPVKVTRSRQGRRDREIHDNPTTGETVFTIHRDRGAYRLPEIDLTIDGGAVERFSITEGDPLSAKADTVWRYRMTRGAWDIRTESRTVLTAGKDSFHLRAQLDAFEGETRVFTKNWSFDIPRNGV